MPNYIAFDAWQGFAPLTQYNSKRASHARVVVLFYIALRSASGYFWGEVENVAKDTVLSRGEAGRIIKDLETVGALELIPHNQIPTHIRKQIETDYPLKPAKKVWRVTGGFTINDTRYEYEWTGTGGVRVQSLNVQKVNILNVHNPECSESEHNSKETIRKKETNNHSTPNGATVVSTKSPEYLSLETVVKAKIYPGVESIGQQGGTLIRFLVIQQATPTLVEKFILWYQGKNPRAAVPRQIRRHKGTDNFDGKFVAWWQQWQHETRPNVISIKPTPQPETPLSETERAAMLAMIQESGLVK